MNEQSRLAILREALSAICEGQWNQAQITLLRERQLGGGDAACLNLLGIISQAHGQWRHARRYFGKAMRADRGYLPAEQNMRRLYELDTFGKTHLPIAVADQTTLLQIRNLSAQTSFRQLDQLDALKCISPSAAGDVTIAAVKQALDWRGYAWAIGTVALATAAGWPLVHSRLHLANVNVLMLYLL